MFIKILKKSWTHVNKSYSIPNFCFTGPLGIQTKLKKGGK